MRERKKIAKKIAKKKTFIYIYITHHHPPLLMKPRKRKKSPFSGFPFRGFNEVPGLLTLTPLPSLSLPGVTILLSLTVFHNLVTETLPQVSDAMPVLGRPWCPTEPRAPYICTNACHGDLGRLSLPSNSVDFSFFFSFSVSTIAVWFLAME